MRWRWLAVVCLALALALGASPAPSQAAALPVEPTGAVRPLHAVGSLRRPTNLRVAPDAQAPRLALLHAEAMLALDGWAVGTGGAAWYHSADAHLHGWIYADNVVLQRPHASGPAATLAPLRRTGMWLTYPLLRRTSAAALVATARAAGLAHLYVEVGISGDGFYGAPGLTALLPAAHHAGLAVIAWVYPSLRDLPADLALSIAAARYVAPSGDRPDGLIADVEENMGEGAVHAYGQLLRAALGSGTLMAIATYPPQSLPGAAYPFASAALSWDAIVPMDYWHTSPRRYSPAEVYRYVRESVAGIRARTRPAMPVAVIGQMFDAFSAAPTPQTPGAAEILACAAAARDSGSLGLSFFEWRHATAEEWRLLAALPALAAAGRATTALHAPGVDLSPGVAGYAPPFGQVGGPWAQLRTAPSTAAPLILIEPHGAVLSVLRLGVAWAYVENSAGVTGWTPRAAIRLIGRSLDKHNHNRSANLAP